MKKLILSALILILASLSLNAQDNITVSLIQDVKLALYENEHDLQPFTANPTLKVRLNGKQFKSGYMTLGSFVEYADLSKKYKGYFIRYGVEGGYSFNNLGLFEIRALIGVGVINREFITKGVGTYHFGSEVAINITNWLNVVSDFYMIRRSDLNNKELQPTVKLGIEIKL